RQLDVELTFNFRLQCGGLELQATVEPHLADVHQQTGNLGVAGQLLEQGTEPVLGIDTLVVVRLQISGSEGLVGKLLAQGGFLGFGAFELSLEILQMEVVTEEQQHSKQQRCHYDLERPWPGADIVEVEVVEIDLLQTFHGLSKTHCCCSPSAAFAPGSVWRTDISNTLA